MLYLLLFITNTHSYTKDEYECMILYNLLNDKKKRKLMKSFTKCVFRNTHIYHIKHDNLTHCILDEFM